MQNAKSFFTFLVGGLIYVGRSVKSPSDRDHVIRSIESLEAGCTFYEVAESKGVAPKDDDL